MEELVLLFDELPTDLLIPIITVLLLIVTIIALTVKRQYFISTFRESLEASIGTYDKNRRDELASKVTEYLEKRLNCTEKPIKGSKLFLAILKIKIIRSMIVEFIFKILPTEEQDKPK